MHHDKRNRSIIKAITYRIISIVADGTIAFLVTQSAEKTLILVVISNIFSIFMYFGHERVWNRISWGKHTIVCK